MSGENGNLIHGRSGIIVLETLRAELAEMADEVDAYLERSGESPTRWFAGRLYEVEEMLAGDCGIDLNDIVLRS